MYESNLIMKEFFKGKGKGDLKIIDVLKYGRLLPICSEEPILIFINPYEEASIPNLMELFKSVKVAVIDRDSAPTPNADVILYCMKLPQKIPAIFAFLIEQEVMVTLATKYDSTLVFGQVEGTNMAVLGDVNKTIKMLDQLIENGVVNPDNM